MEPLELATVVAKALNDKKALDIKVLHVHDLTVLADYFVIASGTSNTHVRSLADEVDFKLGQMGVRPKRVEGAGNRDWELLDYGSVIAHIFYPQARDFYALEHLWADGEEVPLNLEEE